MNILLSTDVYKVGHMEQYPEGVTKVYSYLCARKDFTKTNIDKIVFFGLQYYLKKYLSQKITEQDIEEFQEVYSKICPLPDSTIKKLYDLAHLGYLPLKIKAVPEGREYPLQNVLMTITNTHPDFAWVVNYFESLLLKLWYPCSVATKSKQYRTIAEKYSQLTCDDDNHLDYAVHDFGYRSCSSDESAMIGGAAHLLNFRGSDTILGEYCLQKYYGQSRAQSVPASEHSVMCSFSRENELGAFENLLKIYPSGIVSIVSDTYNLWDVLTDFVYKLKPQIMARDGKVVFRPDSGNPYWIILGNPKSDMYAERMGALELLWSCFGGTTNAKGYRVLNPKVGLIYGDGITLDIYDQILCGMETQGFASSNLVVGVGGLLLQNHSRDDFGFAQKTTYIEVNGEARNVYKDPITDRKKKSHKGLMRLELIGEPDQIISDNVRLASTGLTYRTKDECTWDEESQGELKTVFENGVINEY